MDFIKLRSQLGLFFKKKLCICLKGRDKERTHTYTQTERGAEKFSSHWFTRRITATARLGQAKAKGMEFHSGPPERWQVQSSTAFHWLINRMLDGKSSSQNQTGTHTRCRNGR